MFNLCNLPGFETFSDIKSVLALFAVTIKKKMTTNIPKPVEFGFFFGLCRHLWILCCNFENSRISGGYFNTIKFKIISNLYTEYVKYNLFEEEEFYYLCGAIELGDTLLDPLPFESNQHAYIVHVRNCYLLSG